MKCEAKGIVSFVEFKYKSGRLVLKEIEQFSNPYDPKALYINSEIDFNFTVSLFLNPLYDSYSLRGWKNHI